MSETSGDFSLFVRKPLRFIVLLSEMYVDFCVAMSRETCEMFLTSVVNASFHGRYTELSKSG